MEKTPETPAEVKAEASPETKAETAPNDTEPKLDSAPEAIDTAELPAAEAHGKAPRAKKPKMHLTPEMKADPISKKLILWSMIFAGLAVVCVGLLAYTHYQKKHAQNASHTEEVTEKLAPVITQKLDEIHVKLRNEQDLRAEIVTECTTKETCEFIKGHPEQVRDLLIPILSAVDPDLFSSIENKKLVRKNLLDRLNTLEYPEGGRIVQVHFNNLSIEGEVKPAKTGSHE